MRLDHIAWVCLLRLAETDSLRVFVYGFVFFRPALHVTTLDVPNFSQDLWKLHGTKLEDNHPLPMGPLLAYVVFHLDPICFCSFLPQTERLMLEFNENRIANSELQLFSSETTQRLALPSR